MIAPSWESQVWSSDLLGKPWRDTEHPLGAESQLCLLQQRLLEQEERFGAGGEALEQQDKGVM